MLRAYKYRIYPNADQKAKIDHTIGICRFIYNLALETKISAWRSAQISLSAYDLINQLPELKKDFNWIAEVDSQALQATIKNVDSAFQKFFKGAGFPKFKSKRCGTQSFQCPRNTRRINWEASTLTIPKVPNIKIVIPDKYKFDGKIKTITISKTTTGKYFASILVDNHVGLPLKRPIKSGTTIGIDVGIKSFVVTSDGRQFAPNRKLKNNIDRLKCLQRRASKKQKGSKNYKKANLFVVTLYEKITNQRADYVHKVTTQLIHDSQVESIVIEDLNVAGMIKNNKLAQAISDVSFGRFFEILKYKCDWYGKNLIVINRFAPSSKRCSSCGEINQALTLANREWTCVCGSYHDRDLNAAKNIKYFGLEKYSGEGISGGPVESRRLRWAKKQESDPSK